MSGSVSDEGCGTELNAAGIRSDYLARRLTVSQICRRHGITAHKLYRLADAGQWQRRRPRTGRGRRVRAEAGHMLDRLQRLATRRLAALERAARQNTAGTADDERLVKALTGLMALVSRIEQLKARSLTGAGGGNAPMTPEEADARRQMLARKLVALLEQTGGRNLPSGD